MRTVQLGCESTSVRIDWAAYTDEMMAVDVERGRLLVAGGGEGVGERMNGAERTSLWLYMWIFCLESGDLAILCRATSETRSSFCTRRVVTFALRHRLTKPTEPDGSNLECATLFSSSAPRVLDDRDTVSNAILLTLYPQGQRFVDLVAI